MDTIVAVKGSVVGERREPVWTVREPGLGHELNNEYRLNA